MDVAVVGAGVMGLVAAVTALSSGATVTVHEAAADLTAGAGWRSGGMLAPDCEADGSDALVVDLGRRSMALWPRLLGGIAFDGSLVIAPPRDPGQIGRFARMTANHRAVDGAGIAALEPSLAGRFGAGLYFAREGHLDPRRALPALADRVAALGGTIRYASAPDPDELSADLVVDCRGLGARARHPDLRGVKGEMALIRSRDVALNRPVRLLHHRHPLYVVPRADGLFMIGATTIETDTSAVVTLRSAGELLTQAYALHPAFADAEVVEFNAGLRPAFPDNNPRIARQGRVVSVNGLYRHGWLIAPALAADALGLVDAADPITEESHEGHRQRA